MTNHYAGRLDVSSILYWLNHQELWFGDGDNSGDVIVDGPPLIRHKPVYGLSAQQQQLRAIHGKLVFNQQQGSPVEMLTK